jgi:predicted DNA-binding transcriptional regulator YafY
MSGGALKRQTRLFALAEALRGRKTGVTADELAERFEVSVRTIYRDLEALGDAGLPLLAERGRGGGYALERGYSLPPVNFTAREAAVLVALGRWAAEMKVLPFADTVAGALDKVRGALSASAQRELIERADKLQFVGVPTLPVLPEVRRAVEEAWLTEGTLAIDVAGRDGVTRHRIMRVVGLLMERQVARFLGVEEGDEVVAVRLDRISRAELVRDDGSGSGRTSGRR